MSGSLLNRGMVKRDFAQAMEVTRQRAALPRIAHMTRSSEASSRYGWMGAVPRAKEFEGKRRLEALKGKKIDIANRVWDAGVTLAWDDMRRDQTGTIALKTGELADSLALKPLERVYELLQYGDTTTEGLAYDGQQFFDTDHLEGASGTQSNNVNASTSGLGLLNIADADEPTPEEFVSCVLAVTGHMLGFKDEAGRRVNLDARNFLIVVPPTGGMLQAALPAVSSNNLASGEVNTMAIQNKLGWTFDIMLADTDWTAEFAVLRTDARTKPFICQTEIDPNLIYYDEDSDFFKDSRHYGLASEWIGECAYGDWRHAIKATLS